MGPSAATERTIGWGTVPHFIMHCDYSERLPWTSYRAADDRGKGLFSATSTLGRPRPRRQAGGSCENHRIDAPDLAGFPDGTPLADIAAAYGVPVRTVRRWVKAGPRPEPRPRRSRGAAQTWTPPPSPRCTRKASTRRRSLSGSAAVGEPVSRIAASLGMTQSGIDRALRRAGIKRRRQPRQLTPGRVAGRDGVRRPDIDASDVVAMYQAGWSQIAIAEHYECSRKMVRDRLRTAGVLPKVEARLR